jgi:hypothetical protein
MKSIAEEHSPQVDDTVTIKVQRLNSCPTYWRHTCKCEAIGAPGEMFMPGVFSRMKDWNQFSADRINRVRLVVLFVVASLAGQREVVFRA